MTSLDPLESTARKIIPVSPRFRGVMDAASVSVLALDEDGFYVYTNASARALLGYEPNQIEGHHITDLVQADPGWLRFGLECLKTQQVWCGRVLYRLKHGGLVKVAVNASLDRLTGGAPVIVALLRQVEMAAPDPPRVTEVAPDGRLTAGDIRLLQLMAANFTDEQLAILLSDSLLSVVNQIEAVMQKMNTSSRTQACVEAVKAGLIV